MKTAIICAVLFSFTQVGAVESNSSLPLTISQHKPTGTDFDFIRGHKLAKGYQLQWGMASNAGIESFEVQSTYEDPNDFYSNWYTAGHCINNNRPIFKFTDQNVLPGVINYRIIAVLTQGRGTIVSPVFTTMITK